jgi:hypothetical protein
MALVIGVVVEEIMTAKPPVVSNDNARMHLLLYSKPKTDGVYGANNIRGQSGTKTFK